MLCTSAFQRQSTNFIAAFKMFVLLGTLWLSSCWLNKEERQQDTVQRYKIKGVVIEKTFVNDSIYYFNVYNEEACLICSSLCVVRNHITYERLELSKNRSIVAKLFSTLSLQDSVFVYKNFNVTKVESVDSNTTRVFCYIGWHGDRSSVFDSLQYLLVRNDSIVDIQFLKPVGAHFR
jgi:hypothetical protein